MELSLDEVAALLGIRLTLIVAIEAGDVSGLPNMTHARLYLRDYARLLDLDAEALLEQAWPTIVAKGTACSDICWPAPSTTPAVSPAPRMRRTSTLVAGGTACLLLLGYVWMNLSVAGIRLGPGLVAGSTILPLTPVSSADAPAIQFSAEPAPHPVAALASTDAPHAAPVFQASVPSSAGRPRRIELVAIGEARVQIRAPDSRRPILERTLRPGESLRIPDRDWLTLDTSAAQSLRVVVDGKTDPAVLQGRSGTVRGVELTRGRLSLAIAERVQ